MNRAVYVFLLLSFATTARAQFPLHRALVVSPGQQRPSITCMAQDTTGLLWLGSNMGLLRTDGEQVDVALRTEDVRVDALASTDAGVLVALGDGTLLRCDQHGCDTLLQDTLLAEHPVRAILARPGGEVFLATYGAGLWILHQGHVNRLDTGSGLLDDHVNGLAVLPDGRIVAATDQGLAICSRGRVVDSFDGARGAPDNLILCVAVDAKGVVHAGTDRAGPFSWKPGSLEVRAATDWEHGAVVSLTVHAGSLWAGTERNGVVLVGEDERTLYEQRNGGAFTGRSMSIFADREGAVWWCDGTERIHRADPAVLIIPEHDGVDMRGLSALCVDGQDRIWFATNSGLYCHSTAFSERVAVRRVDLIIDPRTPIVSLSAAADGTVWAATFGNGAFSVYPDGRVSHYTRSNGLGNDNVLAVRARGDTVWFATLDGISRWCNGRFEALVGTQGFTFDVLPLAGDHALIATDGRGLLRWENGTVRPLNSPARTYYSLVSDEHGGVWTCGPATGLCSVGTSALSCVGAGRSPFDGDLFALGRSRGRTIAFGKTGTVALDPLSGRWTELTARLGLADVQAQLNVVANDAQGALWFGCDQGLVRLNLNEHHFRPDVPVIITDVEVDGTSVPVDPVVHTTHDRNDITVYFTALYYPEPGALRFEYRVGAGRIVRTRDREFALPSLPPGTHELQLRAFVGEPGPGSPWHTLVVQVAPPWWQRWQVMVPIVLALGALAYLFIRARDRRMRERERVEQEKVRFQLEALRSQVDPHFLFNSFNTLVALIETDREKAVEHVDALSTFFRSILVVRDKDVIPLDEELDLLQHYFGLERRRFGTAIDLFIHFVEVPSGYLIVPLTLQLLVENALKHNAATAQHPLHIHVSLEGDAIVVRNDVRPRVSSPRSTGFGLESIIKRYAAITPRAVEVLRGEGTFTVRIPLMHCDEHSDRRG
ncbi:MAG: histidine kinase [Flavobacteriales bacterium]|nr:histidine kinase [Flavobacteriales bacterium]